MIKTVSFAPPRSNSSRSTARSAASSSRGAKASGSPSLASSQTALDFSDEPSASVAPPAPIAPPLLLPLEPAAKAKPRAKRVAPPAPPSVAPTQVATSTEVSKAVELSATAKPALQPEATEKKPRKPRVPKDLATQYGENPTKRPEIGPVLEAETPKKRLNKVERAARRELIKPDEGLLARLAQASQINFVKPKAAPRGKGWRFDCGRCGQTSFFETPGGLCACGTIAVKDRL